MPGKTHKNSENEFWITCSNHGYTGGEWFWIKYSSCSIQLRFISWHKHQNIRKEIVVLCLLICYAAFRIC